MAVIEEPAVESSSKSQSKSPAAAASGYESDGYETASETELYDAVSESENCPDNKNTDGFRSVNKSDVEVNHVKDEERHELSDCVDTEVNEKALEKSSDAKLEGNSLFKAGLYEEALVKYELAIQIVEDVPSSTEIRSICHANRAACFSKMGNHAETIKECTKALELNPTYMKALLRRGEAHEKLEHYEESIADMTKVLELDQSNDQARRTIIRLKPLADEKREKMKEEMLGKKLKWLTLASSFFFFLTELLHKACCLVDVMLKHFTFTGVHDLFENSLAIDYWTLGFPPSNRKIPKGKLKEMGNSILGRFGMSTDNFKAVKDPNTGSYSISFQQ